MTMTNEARAASAELADELTHISPKDAAGVFERYMNLKGVEADVKKQLAELKARLEGYFAEYPDEKELEVEGVGRCYLQPRRNVSYDVPALAHDDPALFATLLELDCLSVDAAKAKAHSERLTGLSARAIVGGSTALVYEREGRR